MTIKEHVQVYQRASLSNSVFHNVVKPKTKNSRADWNAEQVQLGASAALPRCQRHAQQPAAQRHLQGVRGFPKTPGFSWV